MDIASLIASRGIKMYALHADESGTNDDCTLIAGVIIPSTNYLKITKEIDSVLTSIFKTRDINLKSLRRKTYSSEGVFTEQQYATFNKEYYLILERYNPVFIIAGVKNSYTSDKVLKIKKSYQLLLERFSLFLKKQKQPGHVVYDKGDSSYHYVYEKHKELISKGSSWGWDYENIINIYDKDDEECRLLQIADLLSDSASRHFNRGDSRHYSRCLPFLDKGPNGEIEGYGLKILS